MDNEELEYSSLEEDLPESGQNHHLRVARDTLLAEVGKKFETAFNQADLELAEYDELELKAEVTAQRIYKFGVALFESFVAQEGEDSYDESLDRFEGTLRDAVAAGHEDALAAIEALGIEDHDLYDETMSALEEAFDDFFTRMREDDELPRAA